MTDETRQRWLEVVDAVAVVALAVVLTFEVLDAGDKSTLRWINAALFCVFALVFAERWRSGALQAFGRTALIIEVALLVVALPVPGITDAGPLRLLRLLRLPLLWASRLRSKHEQLVSRGAALVFGLGAVFAYTAALFILEFEKDRPGSKFHNMGDALWWAATTMTTVGYGDYAPETLGGRITAIVVMVVGISLFGLITALLTTWLRGRPEDEPATKADVAAMLAKLEGRS